MASNLSKLIQTVAKNPQVRRKVMEVAKNPAVQKKAMEIVKDPKFQTQAKKYGNQAMGLLSKKKK